MNLKKWRDRILQQEDLNFLLTNRVPRIALTATATDVTRREIVERLALMDASHFVASFDRPNVRYHIVEKQDVRKQLLQ